MKNEDLNKLKIGIKAKKDTSFMELAILFDKPEFLELLPKLRAKYGFQSSVTQIDYNKAIGKLQDNTQERFDFSIYKNNKELIKHVKENPTWPNDLDSEMDTFERFDTDAYVVCYLFHRPPHFAEMVKQAILCGKVNGDLFETTSTEIVEGDLLLSNASAFMLPRVAVLVSPTSTDLEVKKQVQFARHLYKTEKRLSYYKPRTDKVNRIRSYRKWYWQRLSGKSFKAISDYWNEKLGEKIKDSELDDTRYIKGVQMYKRLLKL